MEKFFSNGQLISFRFGIDILISDKAFFEGILVGLLKKITNSEIKRSETNRIVII